MFFEWRSTKKKCHKNNSYERSPEPDPPKFKPEPIASAPLIKTCSAGVIFLTHKALRSWMDGFGSSTKETTFCTLLPGLNVKGFPVIESVPVKDEGTLAIETWLPFTETIPGCCKVIAVICLSLPHNPPGTTA